MDPPLQAQAAETPTEEPTDGQAPQGEQQTPDIDELLKEVKQLRREAASWRTKLRSAEEAEEQRRRSEMTELEALKADLEAERQARAQAETQRTQQLLRTQVISAAAKAGLNDPEDAVRMLDTSEMTVADNGTVEGLEQALAALLKAKPYLIKSTSGTISPTNPAGGQQRTSDEQLRQELFGGRSKPALFEGGGVYMPQ